MDFEHESLTNEGELEMKLTSESADESDAGASVSAELAVEGVDDSAGDDRDLCEHANAAIDDDPVDEPATAASESASESQIPPVSVAASPSASAPYVQVSSSSEAAPAFAASQGGLIDPEPSTSSGHATFTPASESGDAPNSRTSDLSERTQRMLDPTSDGGPPLVRPIIIVRLADDQMQQAKSEALAEVSQRDAQLCTEMAEAAVHKEFWRRDCEERAIFGH